MPEEKKYEYFETPIYIIMMLAGYETFEKCDIFLSGKEGKNFKRKERQMENFS
jgi:hypothetical protein